jgi:hypothetical protein
MSTYVYGIVHEDDAPDVSRLTGVGEPPTALRLVTARGLAAVVSTAPENLRAKHRDVSAHQVVLEELARRGPLLPLRFGSLAPDDDAVASELERSSSHYGRLLGDLADRVEVNVKAAYPEDAALRTVLSQDAGLRAANDELRAKGGGTPSERIDFGERISAALEALRESSTDRLASALAAHADQVTRITPIGQDFANISLLVHRDKVADLTRRVDALREAQDGLLEIRVNGPLPPYSFVTGPPVSADSAG